MAVVKKAKFSRVIGTSTLLAAWNAATYVAQVEDDRLEAAMRSDVYIPATRDVLKKRGGLWSQNESYTIIRKLSEKV